MLRNNNGSSADNSCINSREFMNSDMDNELTERQAIVYLQDAEEYRSIHHRIDSTSIFIYKIVFSKICRVSIFISIIALHCLAFIEKPSSLSFSPLINANFTRETHEVDPRIYCSLEGTFLCIILIDALIQAYLFGLRKSLHNPWLIALFVLMFISWIDLFVSIAITDYIIRVRRFFRPFFAIQKSQLMKKVLKSLSKTFVDIMSAFALLFVWIIAFSLIAVSLFNNAETGIDLDEGYSTIDKAMFRLLVLITTANNPDAMVKIYNSNRLAFIYFLIFMVIGIFVFMNVLIAIIFNEFRGHVLDSMQTSRVRRRIAIRAVYEVLRRIPNKMMNSMHTLEVEAEVMQRVIENSSMQNWRKRAMVENLQSLGADIIDLDHVKFVLSPLDEHKEDKKVFKIPKFRNPKVNMIQKILLSKSFEIIGLLICVANVIVIGFIVSLKRGQNASKVALNVLNWLFITYYVVEQMCKFFAMGYRTYFSKRGCVYDFIITSVIFIMKIAEESLIDNNKEPLFGNVFLSDLSRITNLIILLRAARIVQLFPSLAPIISTLFDIPWRMKSVIGILILLFYEYALLGMALFSDNISNITMGNETLCRDYSLLDYGGINFSDFFSSIVLLWCLLIVNNWQVFVETFTRINNNNQWVHLYMVSWWIIAVIVVMNCVTAFVIEAYSQRKSFYEKEKVNRTRPHTVTDMVDESMHYLRQSVIVNESFTFQMLFENDLIEPTEEELLSKLKRCTFLCDAYPHISYSKCEG